MATTGTQAGQQPTLEDVMAALKVIQQSQHDLASIVESMTGQGSQPQGLRSPGAITRSDEPENATAASTAYALESKATATPPLAPGDVAPEAPGGSVSPGLKSGFTSRIILTTYPKQIGIKAIPLNWGAGDPQERGPVVVSRNAATIRRRNAIGAHGGSYSIYYALALASKELKSDHRPDFTNTEPAANIGPFPQWGDKKKIVAMDPWGHMAPWLFRDIIEKENVDIRPTIAITRAHMKLPELEDSVRSGRLVPDGKICLNDSGELAVTKFAVEPV